MILNVKFKSGGRIIAEVGCLNASLKISQQTATIEAVQNYLYEHIASVIN